MASFQAGKLYTSKKGVPCKVLSIDGDLMTIQYRSVVRKARKALYCGVEAAMLNFGEDMILSDKIVPIDDPTVEYNYNQSDVKVNTHGESYVSLFKKHHTK